MPPCTLLRMQALICSRTQMAIYLPVWKVKITHSMPEDSGLYGLQYLCWLEDYGSCSLPYFEWIRLQKDG